ncbi:MAG: arylesterase [gamma proteobacterium symbiont of Taylorina sp.]|nr:arylesterase [gamma proteobacterium symbiont of Taylorina sp.]
MKKLLAGCFFVFLMACGDSETEKTFSSLSDDAVILAFGDSLTYGTGTSEASSYPSVLQQLTGYEVINEGIPGELSRDGLQRLPALLDNNQPQLMILIHGGNDILRNFPRQHTADNLKQMIAMAKQRDIKVVMLGVPTFGLLSLESAAIYEQVASADQVPVNLDILSEILSDKQLKSDRIHPNKEGYRLMAEAVYSLLQSSGAL